MVGDLCHSKSGPALAHRRTGGPLVYKGVPPTGGNIVVAVVASQARVGPINGCGNVHNVRVTLDGTSGTGETSKEFGPGARTIQGATESVGCAYPQNNPPVMLTVVASQQTPARVFTTSASVANVATGSFQVVVSVDAQNVLTGVSAS